jgi:uncharacterized membrane protein YphA (DoxX/SURF4 family)
MTTAQAEIGKTVGMQETAKVFQVPSVPGTNATGAVKTFSAMRILFGAIFLFDGILKWQLFATGQMQGVINGEFYTPVWLTANWVLFGTLVGVGETVGGLLLILGLFQRPAALWSAFVMGFIWAFGGFGGYPNAIGASWSTAGYTDMGGDLMLGLVFVVLAFAPYAYGLAKAWKLRERFNGSSMRDRFLRVLLT